MGRLTHDTGLGWTYFITTKAWQSTFLFQVQETAQIIAAKMLEYRDSGNYLLHDFVLMPNHLHLMLTPSSSTSLEKAIQLIKGGSSYVIHKVRGQNLQIWQPGFHESRVTCWTDYQKKRDYIHFNPVAAKLVERPELWSYGSASGRYALNPIPQGLKPIVSQPSNVGAKAPTPGALREASGAEAQVAGAFTQGLKPLPPKESVKTAEESSVGTQTPNFGANNAPPVALAKKGGA